MNRVLLIATIAALLMPVTWGQREGENNRDGERRGESDGRWGGRWDDERRERVFEAMAEERDAREMVEMVMMVRISRDLKLTEDETVLLVRRMSEFRSEIGDLYRQRRGASEKVRRAIESGGDDAILSALADLKALDKRITDLKHAGHERVAEGLTAKQQARLYLYLQDYEENMQRMVQRVRERSRTLETGGRGGPPPPRWQRDDPQREGERGREEDRGPRRPERNVAPDDAPKSADPQPEAQAEPAKDPA